jgi:hypothetical protein
LPPLPRQPWMTDVRLRCIAIPLGRLQCRLRGSAPSRFLNASQKCVIRPFWRIDERMIRPSNIDAPRARFAITTFRGRSDIDRLGF